MSEQLDKAIAAARDAGAALDAALAKPPYEYSPEEVDALRERCMNALDAILAALDAARGEAVVSQLRWKGKSRDYWTKWHEDDDVKAWADEMLSKGFDVEVRHLYAASPASPRVERYGDGVLVHWPEGVEQYVQVGDRVTGNLAPPAALAVHRTPDGYAYRYPSLWGGTVLRFTNGEEVNGSRPLKAVPYWLGTPPAQQPAAAVPEVLIEAARRISADNRSNTHYTREPMFLVQREVRIYGLDSDYAPHFAWIEDGEVCASDLSERIERRFNRGWKIPDRYTRVGYCTRWEFVDAYLSYDAAKERVEYENRKHSGTHRTYVESGCRNREWTALRAWLLAAAERKGE